jgi:starch-binding outer membrane protein, SusD/RagB family
MRTQTLIGVVLGSFVGAFAVPACALDVPDLNNPSLDDLKNHPDAISVGAACTGLLVGNRRNHAAEAGYVDELGILGREAYNFDAADPRYVGELLVGSLNRGSPFGGNFWPQPYANIELGNIILSVLDRVTDLSDANKSAVRGFVATIEALDLLEVIATHDTNGAVIDVNLDPLAPLPPIVDKPAVYARIASLLDGAVTDLMKGDVFPFAMPSGFMGFSSPMTFSRFNRAIRARVAAYTDTDTGKDYAMVIKALGDSFIDESDTLDFNAGVYYTYSTKPGDTTNALINPNIYAHPSVEADARKNVDVVDARFSRKVTKAQRPGKRGTTLNFKGLYPSQESRVALIRNEELLLLKAEALYMTGEVTKAVDELNIVRTRSGRLPPVAANPDMATFISELLYDRRYSLLFEGHRWIDVRRLNRLETLPIFVTVADDGTMTPDTLNVRLPIPLPECNARPGEPACTLGSTN